MGQYTREELLEALQVVSFSISKGEKVLPQFAEGIAQHTLLKSRLRSMYISKALITSEEIRGKYTKEELNEALLPVSSVIGECENAMLNFAEGSSNHTRLTNIIKAMSISKSLIIDEISKRE